MSKSTARVFALTKRNVKEILRDPTSLVFCAVLPVAMLVLMELLFGKMSEQAVMFKIENFAPGITTFGFTFTMLYVALTVSGDRNSAFMARITVSPVRPIEYVISFLLASVPVMIVQSVLFYCVAFCFGLPFGANVLLSVVLLIPSAFFYATAGTLIGSIVGNPNQAGPLSSIIISGAGLLGGVWLPIETMSEGFVTVCKCLPFYNCVLAGKTPFVGGNALVPVLITTAYAVAFLALSVIIHKLKSKT